MREPILVVLWLLLPNLLVLWQTAANTHYQKACLGQNLQTQLQSCLPEVNAPQLLLCILC